MKETHVGVKAFAAIGALGLVLGSSGVAQAQEFTSASFIAPDLIGHAFANVVDAEIGSSSETADATLPTAAPEQLPAPNAEAHPAPPHTGFRALARETLDDFKAFPQRRSTWVILGVGGGLAALAHPVDHKLNSHLVGSKTAERLWVPGHIVGEAYTQVGIALGLYIIGRFVVPANPEQPATTGTSPQTNKWSHMGFDLIRAQIVSQTLVLPFKFGVRRTRPNGQPYSFPSGHAASVFAAASVVERHFGYRAALPTIVIAMYVATSRLHDNVHYLSDVVFGSAVGMASGWTIVGRHGRSSFALTPVAIPGGMALQLSHS